jgi:hypothetical protein
MKRTNSNRTTFGNGGLMTGGSLQNSMINFHTALSIPNMGRLKMAHVLHDLHRFGSDLASPPIYQRALYFSDHLLLDRFIWITGKTPELIFFAHG